MPEALDLKLQAAVSLPTWVLGTKLGSLEEQGSLFNEEPSLNPMVNYL